VRKKIYFLLDFLVVDFFEPLELDFLELLFFAMALSPPFVRANLRVAKIKVNVFLLARRFFLDARFALALLRATRSPRDAREETRAIRAGLRAQRRVDHRLRAEDAEAGGDRKNFMISVALPSAFSAPLRFTQSSSVACDAPRGT
jgi:hypothetical protein